MARQALKGSEDVSHQARKVGRKRAKSRQQELGGKTFESLTPAEKDKLLKHLAVRAGLIDDSDDT